LAPKAPSESVAAIPVRPLARLRHEAEDGVERVGEPYSGEATEVGVPLVELKSTSLFL
jgi:hypothetical protein